MRELMAWMRQEREDEGAGGAEIDAEGNDEEADPDLLLALAEQAEQAVSQRTPGLSATPRVSSGSSCIISITSCIIFIAVQRNLSECAYARACIVSLPAEPHDWMGSSHGLFGLA